MASAACVHPVRGSDGLLNAPRWIRRCVQPGSPGCVPAGRGVPLQHSPAAAGRSGRFHKCPAAAGRSATALLPPVGSAQPTAGPSADASLHVPAGEAPPGEAGDFRKAPLPPRSARGLCVHPARGSVSSPERTRAKRAISEKRPAGAGQSAPSHFRRAAAGPGPRALRSASAISRPIAYPRCRREKRAISVLPRCRRAKRTISVLPRCRRVKRPIAAFPRCGRAKRRITAFPRW